MQEKQAEDAAGARKAAASATPVQAVAFGGSVDTTRVSRASAARIGGKRNPWARHASGAGRHTVRGSFSGVANSTLGSRIQAAGARRLRQAVPLESATTGETWDGGGGGSDCRVARVGAAFVGGTADPSLNAEGNSLGCPCCGSFEDRPEMAVASAGGRRGAGRNALGGAGQSNSRFSEVGEVGDQGFTLHTICLRGFAGLHFILRPLGPTRRARSGSVFYDTFVLRRKIV